ncbi:hypothetical protein [Dickeya dadantii]|uniref:hypothetical protein n=1 Tax=Dickeya dadantii TaxID=204038 RepID=UPI0025432BAB|nr:hypothetical protein [Dickeya dadantii]
MKKHGIPHAFELGFGKENLYKIIMFILKTFLSNAAIKPAVNSKIHQPPLLTAPHLPAHRLPAA